MRRDRGRIGRIAALVALWPGGVLAVWSSWANPAFTTRLRRGGWSVAEHTVRARRTRGPRRTIWVAVAAETVPRAV